MLAKLPVERQALLDLADVIEANPWCQGTMDDEHGGRCLMGWSFRVPSSIRPLDLLSIYLGGVNLVVWNDEPGRSKEEVVATLRAAALHGL